jgi:hypothetical protein
MPNHEEPSCESRGKPANTREPNKAAAVVSTSFYERLNSEGDIP